MTWVNDDRILILGCTIPYNSIIFPEQSALIPVSKLVSKIPLLSIGQQSSPTFYSWLAYCWLSTSLLNVCNSFNTCPMSHELNLLSCTQVRTWQQPSCHVLHHLPLPLLLCTPISHHCPLLHHDPHHCKRVTASHTATCLPTDQDDKCTCPHCKGELGKKWCDWTRCNDLGMALKYYSKDQEWFLSTHWWYLTELLLVLLIWWCMPKCMKLV